MHALLWHGSVGASKKSEFLPPKIIIPSIECFIEQVDILHSGKKKFKFFQAL